MELSDHLRSLDRKGTLVRGYHSEKVNTEGSEGSKQHTGEFKHREKRTRWFSQRIEQIDDQFRQFIKQKQVQWDQEFGDRDRDLPTFFKSNNEKRLHELKETKKKELR
jgi:hypothetical protein